MNMIAEKLTVLLSRYSRVQLAILFGSQASGDASPNSDIDLAVLFDEPIAAGLLYELMEVIGLEFGCPVDIVDMYYAPEPILGQVFKGIRLLGDDITYASLLSKHLLNTADFLPLHERILTERRDKWIG